jgi:hypothetical protein
MLLSNTYSFPTITTKGNLDSRFIRKNLGNNKIIPFEPRRLRNREVGIANYENEERISLDNIVNLVQQRIADGSFDFNQFAIEMKV